jgi:site-specific DNA-methyltransferase (adenine-specific)
MSEPYYQDEQVTLYHGDCREVTEWLAADVLVTDPPYGIAYQSNSRRISLRRSISGDADTSLRDTALEMWGDRPAAVFGTWRRPYPVGTVAKLVWDTKGALGMGDITLPWKPSHQEIYILGRGWRGRRGTDVIVCPPVQSLGYNGRLHPHQKPTALMGHFIERAPDGVITDPFAGSGSTLVVAKQLGRHAIGVEVEESDCEIAAQRLEQGALVVQP